MTDKISREVADQIVSDLTGRLAEVVAEAVEAYIEKPFPELVEGARVEVLEDEAFFASVKKGDQGVITGGYEDWEDGLIINVTMDNGDEWVFRPEVDIKIAPEKRFAKGDFVEVTEALNSWWMGVAVVEEDRVYPSFVYSGRDAISIKMLTGNCEGQIGSFPVDELVAGVEPKPVAKFAVGDRLVIASGGTLGSSDGKIITVTEVVLSDDAGSGGVADQRGPFYYLSSERPSGVWQDFLEPAPELQWAVGDRVLVNDTDGTIARIDDPCCGCDEVRVNFDDGGYSYFGFDDLESLDENNLDPVPVNAGSVRVGDNLIVATKMGDKGADVAVGEKVTVFDVEIGFDGRGELLRTKTADGRLISQYAARFARPGKGDF